MANQLKFDPTRTTLLRRKFIADMNRRFGLISKAIYKLIVTDDVFGLVESKDIKELRKSGLNILEEPTTNAGQFAFMANPQKLQAYQSWLQTQVNAGILTVDGSGNPWTSTYVESAYKKGVNRAYQDTHKLKLAGKPEYYQASQGQFLETAFNQPELLSKVKLLQMRAFELLKGVTATMDSQMSRILADGLVKGEGPAKIARDLRKTVTTLTRTRARMIARTEIINAHAEGQLDSFNLMGVDELNVLAEFSTAEDGLVCSECDSLSGTTYRVDEAHGIIPVHPSCRCAWIPSEIKAKKQTPAQREAAEDLRADKFLEKQAIAKDELAAAKQATADYNKAKAAQLAIKAEADAKIAAIQAKVQIEIQKGIKKAIADKAIADAKIVADKIAADKAAQKLIAKKAKAIEQAKLKPGVISQGNIAQDAYINTKNFKIVNESIGGTTGAKLVSTNSGTRQWIMKQYLKVPDPGKHAQNEFIANRILTNMKISGGGTVSRSTLGEVAGNKAVFNRFVDDLKVLGKEPPAWVKVKMEKDFVTHAWMGNWDVAGMTFDNIGIKGKALYYLDNGGALMYRAQGGLKGSAFGDIVGELNTLRKGTSNPSAAKIFGSITDKKLVKLIDKFEDTFKKSGGWENLKTTLAQSGLAENDRAQLYSRLYHRFSNILKQRDELKSAINAASKTVKSLYKAPNYKFVKKGVFHKVEDMKKAPVFERLEGRKLGEFGSKILKETHVKAVRSFTGSNYEKINESVLAGKFTTTTRNLDKILGGEDLPRFNGLSFRGARQIPEVATKWSNFISGQWAEVEFKAFSSTSVEAARTFSSNEGIHFVIRNKGKYGRYVRPISAHAHENELLLQRGARYKVVGYCDEVYRAPGAGNSHTRTLIIEEIDTLTGGSQLAPRKYSLVELTKYIDDAQAFQGN